MGGLRKNLILYFVRHGDKESGEFFNPLLGHRDQPLSEKGRGQAENLISFFTSREIKRIIASRYLWAQQTARPTSDHLNLQMEIDERLNEIDNGVIETMDEAAVKREYPDFWEAYWARDRDYRFPGGETGGGESPAGFSPERTFPGGGECSLFLP